jgi:cell division protein FtsW
MLFIAGVPRVYLAALAAAALSITAPLVFLKPYRLERLVAFIDPWQHASDTGFQLVQSFLSFAAGGLMGTGLGQGKQKLFYLPEPHTDFILSVVGEELGFLGVAIVIALFVFIIMCGIRIAANAPDFFGAYLSMGISVFVGLQAVINMGVVMGLLPTKGMPLPFVSYGGSSLMVNMISIGVLLNISGQCSFSSET